MPLILLDGLEDLTSCYSTSVMTNPAGRNGNGAQTNSLAGELQYRIPAAQESDTVTIGFAWKASTFNSSASGPWVFGSDLALTTHVIVQMNGASIYVYRGPLTTQLGNIAFAYTPNAWHYIEIQVKLHDTTGSFKLRINGVLLMDLNNIDTKNAGTKTTFDTIKLTGMNIGGTGLSNYDDLYIMTGAGDAFLGDMAVETLYPNGNGNANQWIGSDGNSTDNYLLVDEGGAPVVADYVQSATAAQQDMYTLTDLVRTTGTVLGVCHQSYAAKADSGAKQIKIVNRRAADTKSAALDLTTTFAPFHYMLSTDPETGAAWTIANVNALQSGIEVV